MNKAPVLMNLASYNINGDRVCDFRMAFGRHLSITLPAVFVLIGSAHRFSNMLAAPNL